MSVMRCSACDPIRGYSPGATCGRHRMDMIYSLHIYRTLFKECMVGWSLLCDSLSRCWQSPCRVAKDGDHHMLASEDKSYIEVEVCRGLICRSREREGSQHSATHFSGTACVLSAPLGPGCAQVGCFKLIT
eukprot:scaffold212955_cov18-Tisochrysis_lutea.AAC.1